MARKSKEFLRRSAAAVRGWRTRRRYERERSERAKRGWETRSKIAKRGKPAMPPIVIQEDEYVDIIGIDSVYE